MTADERIRSRRKTPASSSNSYLLRLPRGISTTISTVFGKSARWAAVMAGRYDRATPRAAGRTAARCGARRRDADPVGVALPTGAEARLPTEPALERYARYGHIRDDRYVRNGHHGVGGPLARVRRRAPACISGLGRGRKRLRRRPPRAAKARSARRPRGRSVVVEALLDQLLLHGPTVRVEAGELEVLLELHVDVVLAAPVLLHRDDDPVPEALRLVRVELDVHLGDDLVLLVEDQDDVGLVVDRRRAAQVVVPQAGRLEAFLVGRHDGDHADLLGEGDVLEAVHREGDLLGLRVRLRVLRHFLEVVDDDEELAISGQDTVLLDEHPDVVDRARGLRAAHQEQVLTVPPDPVQARPQARVRGEDGTALTLGDPRSEDLAPHVLDLDRARLVWQVGERRLHRDHPVEQVVLFVLEADVEHVGLPAGRHVARHLEGHRRLAGALRSADQQELAGPEAAADGLVERGETEGNRLVVRQVPARDPIVEVDQHVEGRARNQAPGRRVVTPLGRGLNGGRALDLGAHAVLRFLECRGHGVVPARSS